MKEYKPRAPHILNATEVDEETVEEMFQFNDDAFKDIDEDSHTLYGTTVESIALAIQDKLRTLHTYYKKLATTIKEKYITVSRLAGGYSKKILQKLTVVQDAHSVELRAGSEIRMKTLMAPYIMASKDIPAITVESIQISDYLLNMIKVFSKSDYVTTGMFAFHAETLQRQIQGTSLGELVKLIKTKEGNVVIPVYGFKHEVKYLEFKADGSGVTLKRQKINSKDIRALKFPLLQMKDVANAAMDTVESIDKRFEVIKKDMDKVAKIASHEMDALYAAGDSKSLTRASSVYRPVINAYLSLLYGINLQGYTYTTFLTLITEDAGEV